MAHHKTTIAPDAPPELRTDGSTSTWRPGLDGLRALAVLCVMAYHEPNLELAGGFLGVDLFFVLSGFLITGLLLDERRRSGTISIRSFWNRRARRLLPALAALLVFVVAVTALLGDVSQKRDLQGGITAAFLYLSNWHLIAQHSSYFDQFSSLSPLQHLWSLAIEEQFYVIWPLIVIACLAHSRRLLIVVTAFAAITSIGLMAFLLGDGDPSRSYYGTDARAFSLLVGSLGALFAWHLRPKGRRTLLLSVLGLGALALAFLFIHDSHRWMYHGGFVLFSVVALVVIVLASGETLVSTAMSHPVLRRIGVLSYALYLWHWPIRVYITDTRLGLPDSTAGDIAGILIRLTLTFAMAWLSMTLIERWFRRSELGISRFGLGWIAIGVMLVVLAATVAPSVGSTISTSAGNDRDAQRERSLNSPNDPAKPTLLIVGDSVAITLDNGVRNVIDPSVAVVGGAEIGCALLTSPKALGFDGTWNRNGSECPDHDEYWARLVEAQNPDVVVMLIGAWDLYARDWGSGPVAPGDPEFDQRYRDALASSLSVLSAKGAEVIILTTPCFAPSPGQKSGPQHDIARARRLAQLQREVVDQRNLDTSLVPAAVIDLQAITCDNGFTTSKDGVAWRPDGVHFSVDGARIAANWLLDSLPTSARERLGLSNE